MFKSLSLGFLCAFLWSFACGGGGVGPRVAEDGRIYVRNSTDVAFDVRCVTEDLKEVETVVEPGEVEDVSREVLKAGTKVTITLTSQKAVGYGGDPTGRIQPSVEVELTVNGNMAVWIKSIGFGSAGAIEYEVIGGP